MTLRCQSALIVRMLGQVRHCRLRTVRKACKPMKWQLRQESPRCISTRQHAQAYRPSRARRLLVHQGLVMLTGIIIFFCHFGDCCHLLQPRRLYASLMWCAQSRPPPPKRLKRPSWEEFDDDENGDGLNGDELAAEAIPVTLY